MKPSLPLLALICASCATAPTTPEAGASAMLEKSRQHLQDSIEMLAAKDSMGSATGEEWKRLSVKAQFFERKLQEDKKKLVK